jgi:hypothetical protein
MKKTVFTVFIIGIISCTKTDNSFYVTPDTFPGSAETKPAYDHTSFGVYKGVIIGSTGTIIFRINNGDDNIKGYLAMDKTFDTLSVNQTLTSGLPIVNLAFTGNFSSMTLSADADGNNATLSDIRINGHGSVAGLIVHENSNLQVECYEGTFSGGLTGTMNLVKIGPSDNSAPLYLLEKIDADTVFYRGVGVLNTDSISTTHYFYDNGNPYRTFSGRGSFKNDSFNGNWTSSSPAGVTSGMFKCKRTL